MSSGTPDAGTEAASRSAWTTQVEKDDQQTLDVEWTKAGDAIVLVSTVGLGGDLPRDAKSLVLRSFTQGREPGWSVEMPVTLTVSSGWGVDSSRLALDGEGNIILAGGVYNSRITVEGTTVENDIFLAKFSPDGTPLWLRGAGVSTSTDVQEFFETVAVSLGGGIVLGTTTRSNDHSVAQLSLRDANGELLWTRPISFEFFGPAETLDTWVKSLAFSPTEDILVAGGLYRAGMSAAGYPFVGAWSASGEMLWKDTFGNEGSGQLTTMSADAEGNMYVGYELTWGSVTWAGDRVSGPRHLLLSATSAGAHRFIADTGDTRPLFVATLDGDAIYLAGNTYKDYTSGPPVVARLSASGERVWTESFGDQGKATLAGLRVHPQAGVIAAGSFEGPVTLGGEGVTAIAKDVFLWRLQP